VRYGLFVPPFGELSEPRLLAEMGVCAEQAGWDGLFLWDHVIYRDPATHVSDPWICLAAIATVTDRLRIGTMVTPLARRRPWIVARQLVALDRLSGGRVVLGVGLGLDSGGRELSAFGEELDDRRRAGMLDEAIDLIRSLVSGREVDHHGDHYVADHVRFLPSSVQSPIPLWGAAVWPSKRPLARAGRLDGVFVIHLEEPDELVAALEILGGGSRRPGFDVVVEGWPGADPRPWEQAGATWWFTRFSQFTTTAAELRAVIEAGPPRAEGAEGGAPGGVIAT
jgi:alkanesulfonate monooxygenase SsuD/methylene tetrahydromethanopterin reductase-like flavin-dependent oxidoreductase (luciferase family)